MLSTDEKILQLLLTAKQNPNGLLQYFHITNPDKRIAEESNNIFVASVTSDNNLDGYDFTTFTDLVEILIVTKQQDYREAITIIKNVSYEICKTIMQNEHEFPNRPKIKNISPEFNKDFVLTRGHIMVQVNTEPVNFEITSEEFDICKVLLERVDEE